MKFHYCVRKSENSKQEQQKLHSMNFYQSQITFCFTSSHTRFVVNRRDHCNLKFIYQSNIQRMHKNILDASMLSVRYFVTDG